MTVKQIDDIHRKEKKWACIGYHKVIYLDGSIHNGRPIEQVGAHCLNHNAHSIGVCYIGGLTRAGKPADTRTPAQREALRTLIARLQQQFPGATVHGHSEFADKACPCFDVQREFSISKP